PSLRPSGENVQGRLIFTDSLVCFPLLVRIFSQDLMLARRFWHLRLGRSFAPGSCLTQELLKAGFPLGLRLLPGCGRKVREPGGERLSLLHGAIELYSFGLFAGVVLPVRKRRLLQYMESSFAGLSKSVSEIRVS